MSGKVIAGGAVPTEGTAVTVMAYVPAGVAGCRTVPTLLPQATIPVAEISSTSAIHICP